ncbi:AAA family ATPase [Streptomyces castrisilvae]|uniref:AAA family ATPase n=1 Tax=Streptomyces castrisilvae TaxID=3033811 RepID=A0ABY9HPX3_9ACTN|nr:LuxR family transcriptional regulator [Streptomyces sp. Mut1]WLQ36058.1 AAA family ATPase [Streptomyces sp. Mut1]
MTRSRTDRLRTADSRTPGSRTPGSRTSGRDALRHAARAHLEGGGGVLLTGPEGIGRSTTVTQLADEFAARGHRVLRCAPASSDRDSPFLGLIDLLATAGDAPLAGLAAQERALLEGALLRRTPPAGADPTTGRDALVLRIAVRKVLAALAGTGPLLVVVDDAQWLDEPTARVLLFLARRSVPGYAVLAALRTPLAPSDEVPRPDRATAPELCPQPLRTLPLEPLTVREIAEVLDAHGEGPWPPRLTARLHEAGAGNPRTALELSAALHAAVSSGAPLPDSSEPLPVPESLSRPLLERVEALPARAQQMLLTASAAVRPTVELLRRAGCRYADADVDTCVRHGLLRARDHGTLGFPDPLTPLVLAARAPYALRMDAHRALAGAADDPVERAHHLARLTAGPDPAVADRLVEAAAAARRRGAPGTAARFGRLAAQYTPADGTPTGIGRRLTAAEDGLDAGDFGFARQLAYEVLREAVRPADRVRAWNVVVDSSGQAMSEVADVFPEAVRDAGRDPGLLAPLHYRMSWHAWMVGGSARRARDHAARAAGLAARAGDRRTEVLALTQQAALELFLGLPEAESTLTAALAAPHDAYAMSHHNGPIYLKHRFHLVHDQLEEARAELRTLVYTLRQRGSADCLSQCLIGLAQLEIQRGRCRQGLSMARQSLRIAERAGLSQGPAWYAVALAETAGGSLSQGLAAAEAARRHSEDDDDRLFLPRALHAEGRIRLFSGQYGQAAQLLRRTAEMESAQGQGDPATRRWHADLVEALARSGAVDEAESVGDRARAQAARLGRTGTLAALDRAAATVAEERGRLGAAAAGYEDAAGRLRAAGYPLEEARAHVALGRVRRRLGDEGASRAAFAQALRIFTAAGARAWVAGVRTERDRGEEASFPHLEGNAWPERLSSTERSVVTRVAQGATNREIAAGLTLSVKTVEAALTRAYRKLGAKSRVEITRIVMARPAT